MGHYRFTVLVAAMAAANGTDIGNVGRNVLHAPSQFNLDFSLARGFALGESSRLELRAEFFNALNHVNLAPPVSDLNAVLSSGGNLIRSRVRSLIPARSEKQLRRAIIRA